MGRHRGAQCPWRQGPDLYDGLHPNAEGYLRMVDRFFEQVCAPGGFLGALS
jgi:hypothetical protein